MRPVIGLSTALERAQWGPWDTAAHVLARSYADQVQAAGGIAVLLPPDPRASEDPEPWLDLLDGLIITGGADVDPEAYGAEPHPETKGWVPERDAFEIALARGAMERDLPLLGVCRGMQVMNVARGGTLIQHLPDDLGHEDHRRVMGTFDNADHDVRLADGSLAPAGGGRGDPLHQVAPPPGRGPDRRGARGDGLGDDRRAAGDDRGPGLPVRARRAVASGGRRGLAADPGAGRRGEGEGGAMTLTVLEPATEEVLAELPRAGAEEADAAVARARAAYPAWRAVAPADRARLLHRLADALVSKQEELAVLEARNAGKPIGDARGEMGMVADTFRYYAAAPERALGDTIPVVGGVAMTFREPLGVVALITPWNFPLTIASWKLAPALAAGNTVVLKPAELTPLTALEFEKIAVEAGIPEGVVNVLVGPGSTAGARLVEHPDVAKVAFTGSTEVGRRIAAGAAETIKRVTLELGGKSANIVFADADIAAAAAAAPGAVFGNAGQDCCARSRILVERSALDSFMDALEEAVEGVRVGDPLDEATEMGPLISADQRSTVASFVPEGAPVAIQGDAPQGPGFWFPPTVLCPVDPGDRAVREEIFGPVAVVVPFRDEEEAVALANDTIYGLSGSIWTRDGAKALRVARAVETGVLSINSNTSVRVSTPFGGFKQSGYGRELGPHALDHYTEQKTVYYDTRM